MSTLPEGDDGGIQSTVIVPLGNGCVCSMNSSGWLGGQVPKFGLSLPSPRSSIFRLTRALACLVWIRISPASFLNRVSRPASLSETRVLTATSNPLPHSRSAPPLGERL